MFRVICKIKRAGHLDSGNIQPFSVLLGYVGVLSKCQSIGRAFTLQRRRPVIKIWAVFRGGEYFFSSYSGMLGQRGGAENKKGDSRMAIP